MNIKLEAIRYTMQVLHYAPETSDPPPHQVTTITSYI
jgi:hypothetical protein